MIVYSCSDHAGIATQLLVERQLAAKGQSRQKLGREAFVEEIWKWKEDKGSYITNQMKRLGASADWSREKFTLDPKMSFAVSEAFIRLHKKGLIYKGTYLVNWSPNLQTAVSDLEVDYSEEVGKLYYFKYFLEGEDEFIPVATTRPETILGDSAVCVNPNDVRYQSLIGKNVIVPILGRVIPGKYFKSLIKVLFVIVNYLSVVIGDDYVDSTFGTGALKVTPAHDANDYELGKRHNLTLINVMNKDATINSNGGKYAGLDRFECRDEIWNDITKAGLAIKVDNHVQRVPRSQRGGEIIEPLVSSQWFVRMNVMSEKAITAVKSGEITIKPERFEKVFYNWLENIHDWCISRQLWWGHRSKFGSNDRLVCA